MTADLTLVLAILMAFAFALTNGFHDAANSIATLVATRVARPLPAVAMASVFNLLGPLLFWAPPSPTPSASSSPSTRAHGVPVIGAGLTGAVDLEHVHLAPQPAVQLQPRPRRRPRRRGVPGLGPRRRSTSDRSRTATCTACSGCSIGLLVATSPRIRRRVRPGARRACGRPVERSARLRGPGPHVSSGSRRRSSPSATDRTTPRRPSASSPACSSRAATRRPSPPRSPVVVGASIALTIGTALGGWGIIKTVGRRIFPIRSLDGLVSQSSSASVIFVASILGAPVSTTQVVSSSIVGIGIGRSRWRHVELAGGPRDRPRLADDDARRRPSSPPLSLPIWKFLPGG